MLTEKEIEYLKSLGFNKKRKKHLGCYFFEEGERAIILVVKEGKYKIEFHGMVDDGDDIQYDGYCEMFSKEDDTLELFLTKLFN